MSERVLGLDLSTTETGYCLSEDGVILDIGVIKPSPSCTPAEKIIYVAQEARRLILENKVDELVIEDIYCGFVQAFLILAQLRGAIILTWWQLKMREPISYRATSARKEIGILGTAKKKEVMKGVNRILGLHLKNDNQADAVVLILCYYKLHHPEVKVTTEKKNA